MISQRLNGVLQQVRPEIAVPIIVEVNGNPGQLESALRSAGMNIKYVSKVLPLIYGSASTPVIQSINSQGFVMKIDYDEPTFAL